MIFQWNVCGLLCVFLTYGFLLYANYVASGWLIVPSYAESVWGAVHLLLYNTLLFLAVFAHLRAMLTDPGIVPIVQGTKSKEIRMRKLDGASSDDEDESTDSSSEQCNFLDRAKQFVGEDWTVCAKCESFRPPRAHHCRICHRCVRKMDHHCPWVNNCVGEFNQKYFLQFLFYVGILSLYSIGLVIMTWAFEENMEMMTRGDAPPKLQNEYHLKMVHSICLTIESILFGLFVIAVSCDQLQAIFNDETVVEAFQRRGAQRRRARHSKWKLLRDVCGPGHWSLWILPCSALPAERDLVRFARDANARMEV